MSTLIKQIVPIKPGPDPKTFNVKLLGATFWFSFRWADRLGAWYVNIQNLNTGFTVNGIRVVPYKGLLSQYSGYRGAKIGLLQVIDNEETADDITLNDFGERWQLIHAYNRI